MIFCTDAGTLDEDEFGPDVGMDGAG